MTNAAMAKNGRLRELLFYFLRLGLLLVADLVLQLHEYGAHFVVAQLQFAPG